MCRGRWLSQSLHEAHQARNTKLQDPSSRETPNSKMTNLPQSRFWYLGFGASLVLGAWSLELRAADLSPAETQFFESKIRPILSDKCYKCHSGQAEKVRGSLLLDSKEGVLKGGETGPAIVPGDPEKSLLIKAV